MIQKILLLFFLSFYLIGYTIYAQPGNTNQSRKSWQEAGIPPFQNFSWTKTHDFGRSSIIAQHPNGLIYTACNGGIAEFDGSRWQLIYRQKGIFHLAISDSGNIYTMTTKDFGVLERKQNSANYHFKSIKTHVDIGDGDFGFDIGVFTIKGIVYFVYNKFIVEWNGKEAIVHRAKDSFRSAFQVENEVFVKEMRGALYTIKNRNLILQKGTELLAERVIVKGIKNKGQLLLADALGQFYLYDGKKLIPKFKLEDKVHFIDANFLAIDSSRFAVATRNQGILFYNYEGELLSVINKSSGLTTNFIHSLFLDNQRGLWASHDKGTTRIEIFSPFSFFDDRNGINSSLSQVYRFQQEIYVTSTSELYKMNKYKEGKFTEEKFTKIHDFDSSIHGFSYKDIFIICSSKGLYADQNGFLTKINKTSYFDGISSSRYQDLLFVSGDFGVDIIQDFGSFLPMSERFRKIQTLKLSEQLIKASIFFEDSKGNILINDSENLYRINITSAYNEFTYEIEELLQSRIEDKHYNIGILNGQLTWLKDGELMIYDETNKNFQPHSINEFIAKELDFKPIMVKQKSASKIILSNGAPGKTAIATIDKTGIYKIQHNIFDRFPDFQVWYIMQDLGDIIWFAGMGGLVRFDYKLYKEHEKSVIPIFREIAVGKDSIVSQGVLTSKEDELKIRYDNNSVSLKFALPHFENTKENKFKYMLEGFDDNWTQWDARPEKEYTNLRQGSYKFRLKAKNTFGLEGKEISYSFTILPPWYRTWWAYLSYGLGAILVLLLFGQWRSGQLLKKNLVLETLVNERTEEIRHKNKLLGHQTERLKEMDTMKTRLFANISHEFRTPLTLIKGPIEKLEDAQENTISTTNIKMIRRNSNRLLNLVNQLLDLSKLDSGKLQLNRAEGDVFKCIRAATSSFGSHAASRKMDYQIKVPSRLLWSEFDRDKLEKIIYNLLSNAFKFTPDEGQVVIEVDFRSERLRLKVSDTGSGIAKDKLPHIFDRFFQVDDSYTREKSGSGIGLALTKELVELLGGTIYVESEAGKGTSFRIVLPLQEIQSNRPEVGEEEIPIAVHIEDIEENLEKEKIRSEVQVLIIEDNNDMRHFIKEQLEHDYGIVEARNGKEGLKLANKIMPDLIITDLMMPQMDGITLCKKLKTDLATSHIPVIMLTAKAGIENKLEGLETGADEYLTKPFNARELQVRARNLIGQRQQLRELFSKNISLDPKEITVTSLDEKFLEQVLSILENKYSDSQFGVPQMQKEVGMSKTALHSKIKALTNHPPGELLRNFRLQRATQLLTQRADNISQVAYDVGFNSLSYFTRCFKEYYGTSPSEFLKNR